MFSFIEDIFFIWNHSKDGLTEFINLFNSHDNSIKIDCNIHETSVIFWMSQSSKFLDFLTTIFWTLIYILRKRTRMNCCITVISSKKHTFEGILKKQIIRFLTIYNNMEDFHESYVNIIQSAPRKTTLFRQISQIGQSEILEKLSAAGKHSWSHWGCIEM